MPPPQAPKITDTPATPVEPHRPSASPDSPGLRSRSRQWLGTITHDALSRSSSTSSRHSKSPDNFKDVIAKIGLAAGTVGVDQINPKIVREEDVLEGVRVFLSGLQNILHRTKSGVENSPETIEVGDDTQSIHSFHPIIDAQSNPFDTSEAADMDHMADAGAEFDESRNVHPMLTREESFGDYVMDVLLIGKENAPKLFGRARLDTGMTFNAVNHQVVREIGCTIETYIGEPAVVADGSYYKPIGQVTIPFHFANFRTAKTWQVQFVIFPDSAPFDVCLGRRFIKLADLLKSNPEALPVEFRKETSSQEREKIQKTYQAGHFSNYTREMEDRRYGDRRKSRPKDKESRKRTSSTENKAGDEAKGATLNDTKTETAREQRKEDTAA